MALYLIAQRQHWYDKAGWGAALVLAGLAALVTGFLIAAADRRRAGPPRDGTVRR